MITVRSVIRHYPQNTYSSSSGSRLIRNLTTIFNCEVCGWSCSVSQNEVQVEAFSSAHNPAMYWSGGRDKNGLREVWEHEQKCSK